MLQSGAILCFKSQAAAAAGVLLLLVIVVILEDDVITGMDLPASNQIWQELVGFSDGLLARVWAFLG